MEYTSVSMGHTYVYVDGWMDGWTDGVGERERERGRDYIKLCRQ
jgi:hypothetical protein